MNCQYCSCNTGKSDTKKDKFNYFNFSNHANDQLQLDTICSTSCIVELVTDLSPDLHLIISQAVLTANLPLEKLTKLNKTAELVNK